MDIMKTIFIVHISQNYDFKIFNKFMFVKKSQIEFV